MQGWIKIHRKILQWEWWDDVATRNVFFYLLLKANYQDNVWKNIPIKRGQLITSREKLAQECGLNVQPARRALNNLQNSQQIHIETTNRFSLITIKNYDLYQPSTSQATRRTPTDNPPSNHTIIREEIKKKETTCSKPPSQIAHALANGLLQCILFNNPNFKHDEKTARRWAVDVDKMIRIDKRNPEQIKTVIKFAQSDSFWQSNILSGKKLREKYDQLLMKITPKRSPNAFAS